MMGARNAVRAYALYASEVPATSMLILAYMAVVSKDGDYSPWFSMGHDALARMALGRPEPITDTDRKAVQRAIRHLTEVKAITIDRPPAKRKGEPSTTAYRLHLGPPQACG